MKLPDVGPIVDLVSLVLHTGGLKGRRPVSALLCAVPDSGKTVWIMGRFTENTGIHRAEVITRIGTARWLLQGRRWEKYHHLIVPDLTTSLAGGSGSAEGLQSFLMGLVYEGIKDYHTLHLSHLDLDKPVTIGVVAGIVPTTLHRRRKDWAATGFLRRFLPISYSYTAEQTASTNLLCLDGMNRKPPPISLNYQLWNQVITPPARISRSLASVADGVAYACDIGREKGGGNTIREMLHSLVLAHALRRGSVVADGSDVAAIIRLSKYINYNMQQVPTLYNLYEDPEVEDI